MVWRIVLLSAVLLASTDASHAAGSCGVAGTKLGNCSVSSSVGGDSVTLRGSESSGSRDSSAGEQREQAGRTLVAAPTVDPPCVEQPRSGTQLVVSNCAAAPVAQRDAWGASAPAITIDDLAAFHARAGTQRMEPERFAVVGLPANFVADTAPHVVGGELLGRLADVRFTPVSWRWVFGDGSALTTRTRGSTWEARGEDDFAPTPTSHVFTRPGSYRVTLVVAFTAEYRFAGGDWTSVVGTVSAPANTLDVTVGSAKTVLVQQDCLARPSAPGC